MAPLKTFAVYDHEGNGEDAIVGVIVANIDVDTFEKEWKKYYDWIVENDESPHLWRFVRILLDKGFQACEVKIDEYIPMY